MPDSFVVFSHFPKTRFNDIHVGFPENTCFYLDHLGEDKSVFESVTAALPSYLSQVPKPWILMIYSPTVPDSYEYITSNYRQLSQQPGFDHSQVVLLEDVSMIINNTSCQDCWQQARAFACANDIPFATFNAKNHDLARVLVKIINPGLKFFTNFAINHVKELQALTRRGYRFVHFVDVLQSLFPEENFSKKDDRLKNKTTLEAFLSRAKAKIESEPAVEYLVMQRARQAMVLAIDAMGLVNQQGGQAGFWSAAAGGAAGGAGADEMAAGPASAVGLRRPGGQ